MMEASARTIARAVRQRRQTAVAVTEAALQRIARQNGDLNCFTKVFADEALEAARDVDSRIERGGKVGPLAGVPFAVKDLFDVAGQPTTAGAGLRRNAPAAVADAACVQRLRAAGAILVGTLNMDEFAYGFVTQNAGFGTTSNPHDITRLAGGSSGGSAAAVAAGLVPISLGSDTNGSIRVPAALCGTWGLRPSGTRIDATGVFPFASTLDQPGPLTRSAADLALAFYILRDRPRPGRRRRTLRVARLTGWFDHGLNPAVADIVHRTARALDAFDCALPEAEQARSAAFLLTAAEGGALHLPTLRTRAAEYDPATRDRLIAGALLPAPAYLAALATRDRFQITVDRLFADYDILLAPTVPIVAPRGEDATFRLGDVDVPVRAHLGLYTQPLSLADIPVLSAPAGMLRDLPVGVQLAAPRGREEDLLDFAVELERRGVLGHAQC